MRRTAPHGGNVYAAARDLKRPVESLLDFSASINPLGPSPAVRRALLRGLRFIEHYPDPDCTGLRQILASHWRLSPAHFTIGNGSTELIDLIPRALGIATALIVGPTFSEYVESLRRARAVSRAVYAVKRDAYQPPLKQVVGDLRTQTGNARQVDAIFLCNPNSPTGCACDPNELELLLKETDRAGIWMVVDETFVEYCQKLSIAPLLSRFPRLLLLRSLTKFYALPGLRIGYAVASPRVTSRLRRYQVPWSVSALAQKAAEAALEDRAHARRSLRYLGEERERFARRLSDLKGLTVFPSCANFLLLELPNRYRATAVTERLRRQGVLIRDCSTVQGLNQRTIRVAVRARSENDRLIAAFREIL